jgi:hypothetical protein
MFHIADVGLFGYGGNWSCPSDETSSATCKKSGKVSADSDRRDDEPLYLLQVACLAAAHRQSQFLVCRFVH